MNFAYSINNNTRKRKQIKRIKKAINGKRRSILKKDYNPQNYVKVNRQIRLDYLDFVIAKIEENEFLKN